MLSKINHESIENSNPDEEDLSAEKIYKENDNLPNWNMVNSDQYEGKYDANNNKSGIGKLYNENKDQYVEGEWQNDYLVSIHFAQLLMNDTEYYRLNGLDNLITCKKNNFVGRISQEPFELLVDDFVNIHRVVISSLTIIKILDDDLSTTLSEARNRFKLVLEARAKKTSHDKTALQDMFYISQIQNIMSEANHRDMNVYLLNKIVTDSNISTELKCKADEILQKELLYIERNEQLPSMKLPGQIFDWKSILEQCIDQGVTNMKETLKSIAPSTTFVFSVINDIHNLSNNNVFNISTYDIKLFSDLEITVQEQSYPSDTMKLHFQDFFSGFVSDLWHLVMSKLKNYREECEIYTVYSLTKPIYLQLFKTLIELLINICKHTALNLSKIVQKDANGNLILINLKNISEDSLILISRIKFILRLCRHFKPGELEDNKFDYTFSFFVEKNQSFLKNMFDKTIREWNTSKLNIPDEYLIWLYYIHNTFMSMYNDKIISKDIIKDLYEFLNFLLNMVKQVIETSNFKFEKLRILSRGIIEFVVAMGPYFLHKSIYSESDVSLLMKQCEYAANLNDDLINSVSNIIDTYQNYWEQRSQLVNLFHEKFNVEPLATETKLILSNIDSLAHSALDLKIQCDKYIVFLRSLNEFIIFLLRTQCPWFVKRSNNVSDLYVIEVNSSKESYEVSDVVNYIKECTNSNISIPDHYIFKVTNDMITCIETFLENNTWPMNKKMQATSELLLAMGRSMINFKEQACYEDFDNFLNACTKPFIKVTETSYDMEEFSYRIARIENYYAYTKEITDMSIENALEMCQEKYSILSSNRLKYSFDSVTLHTCYAAYSVQFQIYIDKYIHDEKFGIKEIVNDIQKNLKIKDVETWNTNYKRNYLPKLLAGLSAVWSILESKDVIDQQKIIKPHCIQILCILRLLGADQKCNSFENHLAQVLTGQGKSIVLALLATLLTLTGNSVLIVCYNEYLAARDKNDFQLYFQHFKVHENITYGTFNDVANRILSPKVNNKEYSLRTCISGLLTDSLQATKQSVKTNSSPLHTVLLIDEVDVFFSPEFYGKSYGACTIIYSESVAKIQIRIWNLVLQESDVSVIKSNIDKYAKDILKNNSDDPFVKIYLKSKIIFDKHIEKMISNALEVKNGNPEDLCIKPYKLNESGRIIFVKSDGTYSDSSYFNYYNVFNYFKLKEHDFDDMNLKNFGYLNISTGSVSYAMLPNEHAKILGVTGTLTTLNEPEVSAVLSYNITRASDMPSFFGRCKLSFNSVDDFQMLEDEEAWTKSILSSIMKIIGNERAVLVFFDEEETIDKVKGSFESHVAHLRVFTGNEDKAEMERCIDNAGVSSTVTLVTKRMGRGVDFKSNDSLVENKGGIHVIQTFFSDDIKEEIQIKGRTARKDNVGSYELILCREHLKRNSFQNTQSGTAVETYMDLCNIRDLRAIQKKTEIAENINKSHKIHKMTMELLHSFYNYDPNKRSEYFSRFPFVNAE